MSKGETELTWAALKEDPEVKERSDKIGKILHSQIMDFRLHSPVKLAICVSRLLQMFDNILQHPGSAKFRKVRANNANFKKHVLDAAKQIEDLLLAAGWHTVENMEKHWVFEAAQGTLTWKYLQITQRELQSAQGLIQDKANRHAKELEERKTGPQQQRELLLKQLEEDKASRKDKFRPLVSGPHNIGNVATCTQKPEVLASAEARLQSSSESQH
ncbi:TPA: hypothetical protein ACH3X2_001133 [Trebouxia sp. C0005]